MKILQLLFGWAIKIFQYFFPPHHKIEARYVALFALALLGWGAFGMTFGYVYFRIWHNPQFTPQFSIANPKPEIPGADRIIERTGPPVPNRAGLAHRSHP